MAHIAKIVHSTQFGNRVLSTPAADLSIGEVIDRIAKLNRQLATFWLKSDGWAPAHVAGLLGKSRLDWQVSLSDTLRMWNEGDELTPGELILAWANLGSLVEGSVKLLLSVWYETFKADVENLKKANAFDHKKGVAHSPDGLTLDPLRKYCLARELLEPKHLTLMELIQQRRNAIHAFKDRPSGIKPNSRPRFEDTSSSFGKLSAACRIPTIFMSRQSDRSSHLFPSSLDQ